MTGYKITFMFWSDTIVSQIFENSAGCYSLVKMATIYSLEKDTVENTEDFGHALNVISKLFLRTIIALVSFP